jgi:hypothetical protein
LKLQSSILKLQRRYGSGYGIIFHSTKYSRRDICNVVIELCKCIDGATIRIYLELLGMIKFVLDTRNFCLKIRSKFENKNWNLNPETRISVTGIIVSLMNVSICQRSKAQREMFLSSSEAEYMLSDL